MCSLTTNNESKFLDKELKVVIQDEINNEKHEIKYHYMGRLSVNLNFSD